MTSNASPFSFWLAGWWAVRQREATRKRGRQVRASKRTHTNTYIHVRCAQQPTRGKKGEKREKRHGQTHTHKQDSKKGKKRLRQTSTVEFHSDKQQQQQANAHTHRRAHTQRESARATQSRQRPFNKHNLVNHELVTAPTTATSPTRQRCGVRRGRWVGVYVLGFIVRGRFAHGRQYGFCRGTYSKSCPGSRERRFWFSDPEAAKER